MSYLNFIEKDPPAGLKTKRWEVWSKTGSWLGIIKWYGNWRQYTFWPNVATTFNPDCMNQIAEFCKTKTDEHRLAKV